MSDPTIKSAGSADDDAAHACSPAWLWFATCPCAGTGFGLPRPCPSSQLFMNSMSWGRSFWLLAIVTTLANSGRVVERVAMHATHQQQCRRLHKSGGDGGPSKHTRKGVQGLGRIARCLQCSPRCPRYWRPEVSKVLLFTMFSSCPLEVLGPPEVPKHRYLRCSPPCPCKVLASFKLNWVDISTRSTTGWVDGRMNLYHGLGISTPLQEFVSLKFTGALKIHSVSTNRGVRDNGPRN